MIATQEVTRTRLDANDAYVMLACDGLWDVCSNEDVVSMISDTVRGSFPRAGSIYDDRVRIHTGPHTTAIAWLTPFLKDFLSRRALPFNSASDAFRLHPDFASYGQTPSVA